MKIITSKLLKFFRIKSGQDVASLIILILFIILAIKAIGGGLKSKIKVQMETPLESPWDKDILKRER